MNRLNMLGRMLSRTTNRVGHIAFTNPYAFTGVLVYWLLQIYVMYEVHAAVGTVMFIVGLLALNAIIAIASSRLFKELI